MEAQYYAELANWPWSRLRAHSSWIFPSAAIQDWPSRFSIVPRTKSALCRVCLCTMLQATTIHRSLRTGRLQGWAHPLFRSTLPKAWSLQGAKVASGGRK